VSHITSSKSNEWLLEKKKHILMLSMPLECVIFPPLHTNITDLKHEDMMNQRKNERRKDYARFQAVGEDGVAELSQ